MKISSDVKAIEYLAKVFEENPSWGPAVGAAPIHRSSVMLSVHSAPSFSERAEDGKTVRKFIGQNQIVRDDDL
jgi:hypothetical protein